MIAFTRTASNQTLLVLASLNDTAFANGYTVATDPSRLPDGGWQEVFNSDAGVFGGANVGSGGAVIPVSDGQSHAVIPARGFVVFTKVN